MENKMRNLEKIVMKFEEIVSPNFCNVLAKRVGFIKRSTSQIHGYEFALAMMVPNAFIDAETLDSLCTRMRGINKSCDISASALAQRVNTEGAKRFMQECFGKMLSYTIQNEYSKLQDLPVLSVFKRVLIEDSTKAQLHEKLSLHFKGCGGVASKAELKINFIFDYLSEKFLDFHFVSGITPDQALSSRVFSVLEEGDLLIRDLGYYALARIQEVEARLAFYISRFKVNELVFKCKDDKEAVDLCDLIKQYIDSEGKFDFIVYLGKARHQARLIGCELREEIINKRLRDANRAAKRRGAKTVSKKKLSLLRYALFITNIPSHMIDMEYIIVIYRARWRVELIFKQWKSNLKIHLFKGYNKERFYCLLYGRMIMILLLGAMTCVLMEYASRIGRELSSFKFIKYMIADHAFAKALQNKNSQAFIRNLMRDLRRKLCQNIRKKHASLRSNVRNGRNYYNNLTVNVLKDKLAA
jgi:Transposase DDE domain